MLERTIVHELITAAEQQRPATFRTRPIIRVGSKAALAVGIDNGNDAIKAAVLTADGQLTTLRVPTAYRDTEAIRSGRGEVNYTLGTATFWMGETALRHGGDDLPIGPTKQRLIDPRQRAVIGATIVELLHSAGYAAGEHTVVLGFAIPNGEIVRQKGADGEEHLGVEPATQTVMEAHLKGAVWTIDRTDPDGNVLVWTIRVLTVLPQPQTAGTVIVCTKAPNGATMTPFDECEVIDIGGGDLHDTHVTITPYQMVSRRLGDGTIRIARALKEKFPRMALNDVAAQQALISKRLLVSGRWKDISTEVQEVINSQGQALVAATLPQLAQSQRFVIITGGGVILLHDLLEERLQTVNKVRGEDYELINHTVASLLNAVGAMFGVIYRASGRKD
jgi:hypothetical protein